MDLLVIIHLCCHLNYELVGILEVNMQDLILLVDAEDVCEGGKN